MKKIIVHELPQGSRHQQIINAFDELSLNESLYIVVNHDPIGLRMHFQQFREGQFAWQFIEKQDAMFVYSIQRIEDAPKKQESILNKNLQCGCGRH